MELRVLIGTEVRYDFVFYLLVFFFLGGGARGWDYSREFFGIGNWIVLFYEVLHGNLLDSPFCGEKVRFVSRTFRLFPFYEERLDSHTVDCHALRYLGVYLSQERERTMSASKQEALVLLEQFFFLAIFLIACQAYCTFNMICPLSHSASNPNPIQI